jgi:Uma2 family endonuclease
MKPLSAAGSLDCSTRTLAYTLQMPLTIQLLPSEKQTAFNLKRWRELLADSDLARLPHRIETDRHGHILLSPPPAPAHGNHQSEIAFLLKTLSPTGRVVTECPLSTSDGVKAIDVAWLAPERHQEVRSVTCLVRAPEICVEVLSPANTSAEIAEKVALYFEAGAREVWICEQDGTFRFHFPIPPAIRGASELCSQFPPSLTL